jgi:phosphonate transport system substrate-binding protein
MAAFTLGAVAYDPKVVTIWEGFTAWFAEKGFPFDFVLYRHYERQVEGQFRGEFDVAWNSPLAWLETLHIARRRGRQAQAFAMRDTDRDLTSVIISRTEGPVKVGDLRGRKVAVGAPDSPQATLIPLLHLQEAGLEPGKDVEVRTFDVLFGKHGDHVGGEREAVRALLRGEVDAACLFDGNLLAFSREGTLPAGSTQIVARTAPYDHCVFTALDDVDPVRLQQFRSLILAQRWEDPQVRPLLELEGLRQWHEGRETGFAQLERAVETLSFPGAQTVRDFIDRVGR